MGKPYISSWERMAIQETLRANIIEIPEIRFGALPPGIAEILDEIIDAEVLRELRRQAVKGASLDALVEHLPVAVRK
jgi:hypothetical protein